MRIIFDRKSSRPYQMSTKHKSDLQIAKRTLPRNNMIDTGRIPTLNLMKSTDLDGFHYAITKQDGSVWIGHRFFKAIKDAPEGTVKFAHASFFLAVLLMLQASKSKVCNQLSSTRRLPDLVFPQKPTPKGRVLKAPPKRVWPCEGEMAEIFTRLVHGESCACVFESGLGIVPTFG